MVFELVLCLTILGTGLTALLNRNALGAIVFFVVFGNLLGVAWLTMDAVNVALAEIALGAGVTGILLIVARARLKASADEQVLPATGVALHLAALTICTGLAVVLAIAVLSIEPMDKLGADVSALLPGIGIENPVTGVLLAFRAYDTLLETFVLLAALIATWALSPVKGWPLAPAALDIRSSAERSVAGAFGRILLPAALVMAAYLVWAGSDYPGGAFQGGTVLAGGLVLAALGGAVALPLADSLRLRIAVAAGPLVFLGVALLGLAFGRFLAYPPGLEKTMIVTIEYFLALSIGVTLALLVAGPPAPQRGALEGFRRDDERKNA